MQFEVSKSLIEKIEYLIEQKDDHELLSHLGDMHHADIAEILDKLNLDEATYIVKLLDSTKTAEVLLEIDEDDREKLLDNLTAQEIADEIAEMDTDDATDIISTLSLQLKEEVLENLDDRSHAKNIVELMRYDEDSAGGLMAKELIKVNENWSVTGCMEEMRAQAEYVTRVHSIYVVDNKGKLKGRLSLKDLITAPRTANIKDIYIQNVDYVDVHTPAEEVARIIQKYDLEAIPVIDEIGRLVGRITVDDIIDFITEEADKDYQMAAGISEDVDADDNIWQLIRARLPWLVLALFGGFVAVLVAKQYESAIGEYEFLFYFMPLIVAMAGNVGVQSSAIIVQSIAKGTLTGSTWKRLLKEVGLNIVNGIVLSAILFVGAYLILGTDLITPLTISIALIAVVIVASLIGTFVPIMLDKYNIDPAIATGPFITTSNDIFGLLIFFSIAKIMLGF
jgi:magnesium transporter